MSPLLPPLRRVPALSCGALLLAAGAAMAQQVPAAPAQPAPAAAVRRQAAAVRVDGRAPEVDGRLDEAVWREAEPATDFTQRLPDEGEPASERTEVRFLYDQGALYVGARMYSADPARIQAPVSRRDAGAQSEQLLVSLDTYLDRRTAYTFGVTASGVRLDWYHPADREAVLEPSFDPVWVARVQRDSLGWTAEMRIPYSQLRFNLAEENTWGLNVRRFIPTRNEESYWVMVPPRAPGWASRFGDLGGLRGIRPARRVELMSYVASGADFTADPGEGNPFDDGSTLTARAGGDVKLGLGPNLTLEAAVNPDFGQVEADPAVVNLTAFETVFEERRPFFTEAGQLLAGNGPAYFYSRRIGAAPRESVVAGVLGATGPDEGYAFRDVPVTSTIMGAAKLSGRLASGTSVGALAAVTDREDARTFFVDSLGARRTGRVPVSARAAYGVLRAQQEFGGESSTAGLSLTGMRRDVGGEPLLGGLLPRTAVAGGGDLNLRFQGGTYEVNGYAGGSWVEGSPEAIALLQASSARYFQRPDAGHVELDPGRTSLAGLTGALTVAKLGGKHWLWSNETEARTPGFDINDVGQLRTADDVWNFFSLMYRETRPGRWYRSYRLTAFREDGWNFAGDRTWASNRLDGVVTYRNFWQTVFSGWVDTRAVSEDLTRGGPLAGLPRAPYFSVRVANSPAATTRFRGNVAVGSSEQGHRSLAAGAGITFRPAPAWQLSVDPRYERDTNPRQYIGVVANRGGPAATYGNRYVFSTVETSTLASQFRLDYTFTPDLSLELYAEPFASSGRFHGFGELPAPRSRALTLYGRGGTTVTRPQGETGPYLVRYGPAAGQTFALRFRDFNVRSFRSNAVMRWEWRPGSTLFLVWQQDRFDQLQRGGLVGPGSLRDAFSAAGDNFLALKVTYWIPLS